MSGDLHGKTERVIAAATGFREKCGNMGKAAARWPYWRRSGGAAGPCGGGGLG
jgi:hypothetical protein